MKPKNESLNSLVQRQLDLDSGVVDALEQLNNGMAALLDQSGIYGPTIQDIESLSPLMENLKRCYTNSGNSRDSLLKRAGDSAEPDPDDESQATLRSVIDTLPVSQARVLHSRRQSIHSRMRLAEQQMTANQVVIFYSTEFHRRYLLGVLQCDVNETNYKADGQAFKLPPEKIIGRNC